MCNKTLQPRGKKDEGMAIKSLSGHESVGIMPQGLKACAVPWPSNLLFFLPAVSDAPQRVGQLAA
jgi:hypothetical protein